MDTIVYTVEALLKPRQPVVSRIYEKLIRAVKKLGPFEVEPKKTCVHLVTSSAFAGVHFRAGAVLLSLRTAAPIESPRVRKCEQLSKHRFHCEILLESEQDVDRELSDWLRVAYELT